MGCFQSRPTHDNDEPQQAPPVIKTNSVRKPLDRGRLASKFHEHEVRIVSDEERRQGVKPCYPCPICFLHYNKILGCTECKNCICLNCFLAYQKKQMENLKCPFCTSGDSLFTDYQMEAHSYFQSSIRNAPQMEEKDRSNMKISHSANHLKPQALKIHKTFSIIESNDE